MKMRKDDALLRDYAQGDQDAFAELVRRYGALVFGACIRHLRNQHLAEDAAQAVFLTLAQKADKLKPKTTLVPWLFATSKLVCRNAQRREHRRQKHEQPLDDSIPANPNQDNDIALFEAIDRLHGPEREAVVLRFLQELSLAEVGEAQGISEDAARMRIQRGLAKLRDKFVPSIALSPGLFARLATPTAAPANIQSLISGGTMFTSLALPIGIATLVIGAAAAPAISHRLNAPPKPRAPIASPPITTTKPKPTSADPRKLDQPFTLVYHVTVHNLKSKKLKDFIYKELSTEADKLFDEDRINKQEAQKRKDDGRKGLDRPSGEFTMTISYDGNSLFVLTERPAGQPDKAVALIQDGHTFELFPGPNNFTACRREGVTPYQLFNVPYIGPELPYLPLQQGEKVLCFQAVPMSSVQTGNRMVYVFGRIERAKDGKVKRVTQGISRLSQEYRLSSYTNVGDKPVAQSISFFQYVGFRDWPDQGTLYERTDYKLTSASTEALSPDTFIPETHMNENTRFQVNLPGNAYKVFHYSKSKGSLAQQIENAKVRS